MRCEASRAAAARSADGERKRPGSASRSRCSAASPISTPAVATTGPSRSIAVVAREGLRTAGTRQAKRDGKVFVRVLEETMGFFLQKQDCKHCSSDIACCEI
jgi:hypothetical protein